MGIAEVEVQGRVAHVRVVEFPRGAKPLLGAVPLEEMDWHISTAEKKVGSKPLVATWSTATPLWLPWVFNPSENHLIFTCFDRFFWVG